jgi:hypothetical protein
MEKSVQTSGFQFTDLVLFVFPPAIVTFFFWITSARDITILQASLAFILLCIPWAGYCRWKRELGSELPLYSIIALAYWVYYALPLFWASRDKTSFGMRIFTLTDELATKTMLLAVVGVLAIGLGMSLKIGRKWSLTRFPDIQADTRGWSYIRVLLVVGVLSNLYDSLPYMFGEAGRQIILILQKDIPLLAFALLFRSYLSGTASRTDRIFIVFYIAISFLTGLSSGWLGAFAIPMIICTIVYIAEKRKVPRLMIGCIVVYVLFFQASKVDVRERYWVKQESSSRIERIEFWFKESLARWEYALDEPTDQAIRDLAYQSLSRLSLLEQSANVLDLTPREVPYQEGRLYAYMSYTLIPRFMWPDKPSVNEANRFYQVEYGLTTERNLSSVSIAVGVLTESYINFGWPGVVFIMFLLGILFDYIQKTFLSKASGLLFTGIGIILIPYFMVLEAQMAQYLGGMVQRVFMIMLIMVPVIRFPKAQKSLARNNLEVNVSTVS